MGLELDMEWAGVPRSFGPILTNTLRELVNNSFKESFYGKRKKKVINALTVFFISHKSSDKIFLKWIVNQYPKGTR